MARSSATRTGPKKGIARNTGHAGSRRASAIMAAWAVGRSVRSTSISAYQASARNRAPRSASCASHRARSPTPYTLVPGVGIARARNTAFSRSITRVASSTRFR